MPECCVCLEDVWRLVKLHDSHGVCFKCSKKLRDQPCPICRHPPLPPAWLRSMVTILGAPLTCRILLPNRLTDQALLHIVGVDGLSLKFGSLEQRNNKDIVLEAVQHAGEALFYASIGLRNCKEVVIAAINQDYGARLWMGASMWDDLDVKRALKMRDEVY